MKLVAFAFARGRRSYLPVVLILTLAAASLLAVGCSKDESSVTFPEPEPQIPNDWLFTVSGFAADDVYAAGAKGAMFHYDGADWTLISMGTSQPIVQIWNSGDGVIYACGHGGSLWSISSTASSWSGLDSGTTADLYGVGSFDGTVHACGANGAIRRRASGTWSGVAGQIIRRDPTSGAPEDTLAMNEDIRSLIVVNQYGFGGAYEIPDWEGEPIGIEGTAGMILASDEEYDWLLRPIRGGQQVEPEWVLSSASSSTVVTDNYLGTSWGYLFKLEVGAGDALVWNKIHPQITSDPGRGIRGMWRDADSNLYMVTDEGSIIYQTPDFEYESSGERTVLYDGITPLMGIWGADPMNLFIVGDYDAKIMIASHNQGTGEFTFELTDLDFPDKGLGLEPGYDHLGLPRR